MQKYGDFWLIPKNKPYSLQSCCDGLGNLRQRERYRIKYVVVAGVRPQSKVAGDFTLGARPGGCAFHFGARPEACGLHSVEKIKQC